VRRLSSGFPDRSPIRRHLLRPCVGAPFIGTAVPDVLQGPLGSRWTFDCDHPQRRSIEVQDAEATLGMVTAGTTYWFRQPELCPLASPRAWLGALGDPVNRAA